jgi:hypothetical protein
MAIPPRTIKGLQDIASHSGRAREGAIPHKAYMRLSCLEMEKFRRTRERESAMVRISSINARFQQIDAEKAMILRAMKEQDCTAPAGSPGGDSGYTPIRKKNTGGFRLKY